MKFNIHPFFFFFFFIILVPRKVMGVKFIKGWQEKNGTSAILKMVKKIIIIIFFPPKYTGRSYMKLVNHQISASSFYYILFIIFFQV